MIKTYLHIVLVFFLFISCEDSIDNGPIKFEIKSAKDTGLDFSNTLNYSSELNIIEYLYYYNGGGVAVGDINNDGLEDLYFSANQLPDKLFLNLGNLKFRDISNSSGLNKDSSWSNGVSMEDVNGDGFLDIYVCKVGNYKNLSSHNLLYINLGNSTFEESSAKFGLDFSGFSTQASFLDYDLDGDLDMYLMNHSVHSVRSYGKSVKRSEKDSLSGDLFFENRINEKENSFINVTDKSRIYNSSLGYGLAIISSDINDDGWPDLYIGNDFHENDYIYINNKDGTFTESIKRLTTHTSRFTMGVDIADINNDGFRDVFTTDMLPYDKEVFLKSAGEDSDKVNQIKREFGFEDQLARNHLLLNSGNNSFNDIALQTNTFATDWSWSALIQDFDNDSWNDIFVTNGIVKRPNDLDYINFLSDVDFGNYMVSQQSNLKKVLIDQMPTLKIKNFLFKNLDGFNFTSTTSSQIGKPSFSNGAAYSDLDNDGDLDLIVNNLNDEAWIMENVSENDNNYISFEFEEKSNSKGAKIELYSGNKSFVKEYITTKGFQSSSTHKIHFGLESISKIDSIKIIWPENIQQIITSFDINHNNKISRTLSVKKKSFKSSNVNTHLEKFPFKHVENLFEDYDYEKLIPEKLSNEGPALVVNDFNGDGLDDLFLGGATYQSGQIFIKQINGKYEILKNPEIDKDSNYEDIDASAFDFDSDGDLDLYVVSGGNESKELQPLSQDRIYLNNGKGLFTKLPLSLPFTNGATISSADIDNDGIVDFFVGARSIPRSYGLSPFSFIIKNTGKNLEIVSKQRLGMITDSVFEDLNSDGFVDLIICGDWMPITVLINQNGSEFIDKTIEFGLGDSEGLWNTIEITDINNDGMKDILAGNVGLNSKLKADLSKPINLFLDDFDNNGQIDPIIFYTLFGKYLTFSSKNKLTEQIPAIKKKYISYKEFSKVETIEDLTGKSEDEILEIKSIKELRSMLYLGSKEGFKKIPLPKEAQMSNIQDFIVESIDGNVKVKFVGNHYDYVTELGKNMSNSGGEITDFENFKFNTYKSLNLPNSFNGRRIHKLSSNQYLIVLNNNHSYILTPNYEK